MFLELLICLRDTHLTNDILIEFEIQQKFVMLLFILFMANHNGILHMSWQ